MSKFIVQQTTLLFLFLKHLLELNKRLQFKPCLWTNVPDTILIPPLHSPLQWKEQCFAFSLAHCGYKHYLCRHGQNASLFVPFSTLLIQGGGLSSLPFVLFFCFFGHYSHCFLSVFFESLSLKGVMLRAFNSWQMLI